VVRFEPNEKGIKQIGEAVAKASAGAGNEVAKTHAGKSEDEVRSALKAAMEKRGYSRYEPPEGMVRQIANGNPPTYR